MIITSIFVLFYILGVIAAVEAIMVVRSAQGAVAWSLLLLVFPFLVLPLYLVFGRNTFEKTLFQYDQSVSEIEQVVAEKEAALKPWYATAEVPDPSFCTVVSKLTGAHLTRGNRAALLINGEATFRSMFDGIANAENYVLAQFYMVHDDELGRAFQQALVERARAGVAVFFLYDELGSQGLPDSFLGELRAAGVTVSSFGLAMGRRWRFQLNFRNHRKILVVDGASGWIGGHNVGDEYMGRDPGFSPWRDTHVRLDGPAVIQLQAVVLRDWYAATGEVLDLQWEPVAPADGDSDSDRNGDGDGDGYGDGERDGYGNISATILHSAPSERIQTGGLLLLAALQTARQRVWLSAPYFIPDLATVKALQIAALRGLDVRILTTRKSDSLTVKFAGFHFIEELRGMGIRFYAYGPGFLHEKVVLVDDCISSIGSANVDNRSFQLNFEAAALIIDKRFARQMQSMFERDFDHADRLEPQTFSDRPFWWRFGVRLARLASPVL